LACGVSPTSHCSGSSTSGTFTDPVVEPTFMNFTSFVHTSSAIDACASSVLPPTCGVKITFFNPRSGL
jgi:hypothetical protein